MPEDNKTIEFDFDSAVPVNASDPEARIPSPDFDFESAVPVTEEQETIPQMLLQNAKEAGMETLAMVGKVASVIRWPFWRFIEHPVSTVVAGIQEPEGKTVGGVLSKAGQAFVPFKKIPKDEYGTYGEVWGNYYQSVAQLKGYAKDEVPTPEWYKFIASYGSAMGVETPVLSGASKVATAIATRAATTEEASAIRDNFKPLKDYLESKNVKVESLYKEGNIVKINDTQEIFINKNLTAVLSGGEIRIPRFAKVNNLPTKNVPSTKVVDTGIVPTKGATISGVAPTVPVPPITNNLIDINKALEVSEDSVKAIVEQAGGKFVGLSEDKSAVMFNTRGGGTKQVNLSDLSVDSVKASIKEFEDAGGITVPETLAQLNERLSKTSQPATVPQSPLHAEALKYKTAEEFKKGFLKSASKYQQILPVFKEESSMGKLYSSQEILKMAEDKYGSLDAIYNEAHSAKATPVAATPPAPPVKPPSDVTAVSPENRPPEYIKNRKTVGTNRRKRVVLNSLKKMFREKIIVLSERARDLDESFMHELRKNVFEINRYNQEYKIRATPFLDGVKKLSKEDFNDLGLSLNNGDVAITKEILQRNGLTEAYTEARSILSDFFIRAKENNIELGYTEEYWPRRVDNLEGFLEYLRGGDSWTVIEREIAKETIRLGKGELSMSEQAEIADMVIRGYGAEKIGIKSPTNIKARKISKLDANMNSYYKDFRTSFLEYIDAMNNKIEIEKFLGNGKNVEESIGAYVKRLIDAGIINSKGEREAVDIIRAYINKRSVSPGVSLYRDIAYIYTMGNPGSALTQVQDIAFSLYKNGYFETGKALINKNKWTKEDIFIHNIAEEFSDERASAKAVRAVFRGVGLELVDAVGKITYETAAYARLVKEAKNGTLDLSKVWRDQAYQEKVKQDIIDGKITNDIRYLVFSELSDMQPVSILETPQGYATGGDARLFYMLKTYAVKQFNIQYREILKEIPKNPKKGLRNFVRLTTALMLMGMSADALKDMLYNRVIRLNDLVFDNILKTLGSSRYQTYKARQEGIATTAIQSILPPIVLLDDLQSDYMRATKEDSDFTISDSKTVSAIPFVGKFHYWWVGGGKKIEEERIDKEFEN